MNKPLTATALALSALLAMTPGFSRASAQEPREGSGAQTAEYEPKVSEGRVTLELRPSWADRRLRFELSANTHSGDLGSLDLLDLVELVVGDRRFRPTTAGRLSGHHARTTLSFDLAERPERFALEIRGVPDVPVRTLRWPAEPAAGEAATWIVVGGADPGGLAVLSAGDLEPIMSIEGLEAVHGSAIQADGAVAYALNMSDASRAVTAFAVPSGKRLWQTALPAPSHHAVAEARKNRLYVTFGRMGLDPERPRGVAELRPDGSVASLLRTEGTAYYLEPAPDGSRLYVTVQGPDQLLEVRLPELRVHRAVDLPGTPSHLALTPDGARLYVALAAGKVAEMDTRTLTVMAEAETGPDTHAVALAGTPPRLFVAVRGRGLILALDPETLERRQVSEIAGLPEHLTRLPDGALLVSDGSTRELIKLDPTRLTVEARAALPFRPHQSAASGSR